jgi:hypothetical protein
MAYLTSIFPRFDTSYLPSFTYLFNTVGDLNCDQFNVLRYCVLDLGYSKVDSCQLALVNDMIEKFEQSPHFFRLQFVGGEVDAERRAYIEMLKNLPALNDLKEKTSGGGGFVSEETAAVVLMQAKCYQQGVIDALKRENFELAEYRLKMLKLMRENLQQECVNLIYEGVVELVNSWLLLRENKFGAI